VPNARPPGIADVGALCGKRLSAVESDCEFPATVPFEQCRLEKEDHLIIPPRILVAAAIIAIAGSTTASASPLIRNAGPSVYIARPIMRYAHTPPRPPAPRYRITMADVMRARAGGWQQVEAASPFGLNGAGTALLMTDGTVMVQDNESSWYSLSPNKNGNYVEGTWTQKASLPAGYGPLYFASAVLDDGKIEINGGEYNFFHGAETNLGAIYDPLADNWTSVTGPSGWTQIGDASSVVLEDGTFMLGNCCYTAQALLNEGSLTWTLTGAGKSDTNSEEGWTLLPDGKVLTSDVFGEPNSEHYKPGSGSWSTAGTVPVDLTNAFETGPQILRPDGTVFFAGASQHSAIYNTHTHQWIAGPDFPIIGNQQLDIADGPAALLTNGDVIMAASPGVYSAPASMLIFDGTQFTAIANPPNAPNDSSYNMRLLVLPTGQILETDSSDDVEIYTPRVPPDRTIAPAISSVPTTLTHGTTYTISGVRFNGFSQANAYGDDAQAATNYPLVRIRNDATGHVFYARTHNHSFMGVASQAMVSTMFDVPSSIELGASTLEVVANGIHSAPVAVTIN
jgi:hypothetical protein